MRLGSQYLLKIAAEESQEGVLAGIPEPRDESGAQGADRVYGQYGAVDAAGVNSLARIALSGLSSVNPALGAMGGLAMQVLPAALGNTQAWQQHAAGPFKEFTAPRQLGFGPGNTQNVIDRQQFDRYTSQYTTPALGKSIQDSGMVKYLENWAKEMKFIKPETSLSNFDPSTVGMFAQQFGMAFPEVKEFVRKIIPGAVFDTSGLRNAALMLNNGGYSQQAADRVYRGWNQFMASKDYPTDLEPEFVQHAFAKAVSLFGEGATWKHAENIARVAQSVRQTLINPNDKQGMAKAIAIAASGGVGKSIAVNPANAIAKYERIRSMAEATGLDPARLSAIGESARSAGLPAGIFAEILAENSALLTRSALEGEDDVNTEQVIGDIVQRYSKVVQNGKSGAALAYLAKARPKALAAARSRGPEAVANLIGITARDPGLRRILSSTNIKNDMPRGTLSYADLKAANMADIQHTARAYRQPELGDLASMASGNSKKFDKLVSSKDYMKDPRLASYLGGRGRFSHLAPALRSLSVSSDAEEFKHRYNDKITADSRVTDTGFNTKPMVNNAPPLMEAPSTEKYVAPKVKPLGI
jgi:hypothetical protein